MAAPAEVFQPGIDYRFPERGASLEPLHQGALTLAGNFYPGSQARAIREMLRELTGSAENPWASLQEMSPGEFAERIGTNGFRSLIPYLLEGYETYVRGENTWFDRTNVLTPEQKEYLREHPIASFSLEIAINTVPQIYSGGLGMLNGDGARQESDMDLPVDNISLLYSQGYFFQTIDYEGNQVETYRDQNGNEYPMEEVVDQAGQALRIAIPLGDHQVFVRAWRVSVGRNNLYLLDTNIDENDKKEDRWITGHLYGGDQDTRIRQEIVLGVGGVRLLEALGKEPGIIHLQEGHASFAVLEAIAQKVRKGVPLDKAAWDVHDSTAFTDHTVVIGDFFSEALVKRYLHPLAQMLGVDVDQIYDLGADDQGVFSMTDLALRVASKLNGVSALHTEVLKESHPRNDFESITNGVHIETWLAEPMQRLFDRYIGSQWREDAANTEIFERIYEIPEEELWSAKQEQKNRYISYLNNKHGLSLDPNILTIGSARRFATYKRGGLLLSDIEEMAEIIGDPAMPVQIIYAGKAHPHDDPGKGIINEVHRKMQVINERARKRSGNAQEGIERKTGQIVFISGYDMQLAGLLVAGTDVWMNTPLRKLEASGTSGMKAGLNGTLQLTEIDGWADEVDWSNKGWIIGSKDDDGTAMSKEEQAWVDKRDGQELRRLIRDEIAPMFYGDRAQWVARMKHTMVEVTRNFSTRRMKREQVERLYLPILEKKLQQAA